MEPKNTEPIEPITMPLPSTKLSLKMLLKISSISSFLIFCWEHIATQYEITARPSTGLLILESNLKYIFKLLGSYFARLSSFIWYLKWSSLIVTFKNLLTPLIGSIISPFHTLTGYYETVVANYSGNLSLIISGSSLLLAAAGYVAYRLSPTVRKFIKF